MTDLDKARGWAEENKGTDYLTPRIEAAIDIILSLPDQWVDAEKLKEIIADMDHCLKMESTSDFSKGIDNATTSWRDALKALITPKLPTLADMTQEERAACQWMQADVKLSGEGSVTCVIADPRNPGAKVRVWAPHGGSDDIEAGRVTPLPDLPKLQWPSSIAQEPTGASLDPQENIDASIEYIKKTASDQQPNTSETPNSSINPEDVPPNEPWLIEVDGEKAIGARYRGDAVVPWSVAALDGSFAGDYNDNEVSLIHKLVPETHALPEGMRLADSEEYGRIVVSPGTDQEDDYLVFHSEKDVLYGASWGYLHDHEFTYVDGDH